MRIIIKQLNLVLIIIFLIGCNEEIIGSNANETINHVEWTLGGAGNSSGYNTSNSSLQASGIITNIGDTTILAPWYIEAEFYSDSTFTLILGGVQDNYNVNLDVNTSAIWLLNFSSSEIVESNYPNFAIKNFRAFRKK